MTEHIISPLTVAALAAESDATQDARTIRLLTLDEAENRARAVLERAEWDAQREWREMRRGTEGAVAGWRILMNRADEAAELYRMAMRRRMLEEIGEP